MDEMGGEIRVYYCDYCKRHFYVPKDSPNKIININDPRLFLLCPWCEDHCNEVEFAFPTVAEIRDD